MTYEVEQKFRVADPAALAAALANHGIVPGEPVLQVDRYFNHPARDFAQTDEALRIRSVGPRNWVTYKGPKIDAATKTRRELEFPLVDGETACKNMAELLAMLGFQPTAAVRKQRRGAHLEFHQRPFEVLLDDVEGLGLFVEIETMAEPADLGGAQGDLLALAEQLGLHRAERRSYLEMLLQREARMGPSGR